MKEPFGVRGVLTSAHCSNTRYSTGDGTVRKLLNFNGEMFGGSYDIQWHTAPAASGFTITNRIVGETARVSGAFAHDIQRLGDPVCKYGMVTGKSCGIISLLNDTHPLPFPAPDAKTWYRVNCNPNHLLTLTCAKGGDSGSPVYAKFTIGTLSNIVAYGELVGGATVLN